MLSTCFLTLLIFLMIDPASSKRSRLVSPDAAIFNDLGGMAKAPNGSAGYHDIFEGIAKGLEEAVKSCKRRFRWNRWNCPVDTSTVLDRPPSFEGNRENAFLDAISAAGITYYVSKKCDQSNEACSCNARPYRRFFPKPDSLDSGTFWDYKGCRQNVWFGGDLALHFLGKHVGEVSRATGEVKKHNHRVGVTVVRNSLFTWCKCHGPTGSCSIKTCWKMLPDFKKLAKRLKRKYQMAIEVQYQNDSLHPTVSYSPFQKHPYSHLAYSELSPSYCQPEPAIGHLGIIGRECRPDSTEPGSKAKFEIECLLLCCGQPIGRYRGTKTYDCGCETVCKKCVKKVWKYYCKPRVQYV